MEFHEFIYEMQRDIRLFKQHWEKMHRADPENYPLEMPEDDTGSWIEHFLIWRS